MPSLSILITGNEVLDGRVAETNSHFLITQCAQLGVPAAHVLSCGDSIEEISSALKYLARDSEVIIVSGGLGPTTDDLTREAIAKFSKTELILDGDVLARLEEYFRKRQRAFDGSNCKQALFPEGSTLINNPVGSALGFMLHTKPKSPHVTKLIMALPGVPKELYAMFQESCAGVIKRHFSNHKAPARSVFKIFGLGESVINSRIRMAELPSEISVGYRAHFPEVELVLKSATQGQLSSAAKKAVASIGKEYIYSENAGTLSKTVHNLLISKKLTIATAESCTAGLLSALLTDNPGSSGYFLGGVLAYSNEVKIRELEVQRKTIKESGAVSRETAQEMALGVWKKFTSGIGISITGIAGPDGATAHKPVGTFYIGIASGKTVSTYRFFIGSSRENVRTYAAWMALDVIRRHLLKLPVHEHKK